MVKELPPSKVGATRWHLEQLMIGEWVVLRGKRNTHVQEAIKGGLYT